MPIDESQRIVPGSPYGESKFILERMLHWLDRICGVPFACLRYFNAAGATPTRGEDHDPELHLIPLVLRVALGKREKVFIFGDDYPTRDGTCVRDYIHVIDLAQAHILALGALESGSRFYNLGNGEGFTVKEVIHAAGEITGRMICTDVGPRRAGDPAVLVAASNKIRKELGWVPRFPHVREIIQAHGNGTGLIPTVIEEAFERHGLNVFDRSTFTRKPGAQRLANCELFATTSKKWQTGGNRR
jgi:UDP-glucose 4-epimerase